MPLIFQYGSNTNTHRLNAQERLGGSAVVVGRARTISEFDIAFDVWSQTNGCAAADLVSAPGTGRLAWGVLYEVPADRIRGLSRRDERRTLDEIEGPRYEARSIQVRTDDGVEVEATTYLVKAQDRHEGLWTSTAYLRHIVSGLRDHKIPEEYIARVIEIAVETNQKATGVPPDGPEDLRALFKTDV